MSINDEVNEQYLIDTEKKIQSQKGQPLLMVKNTILANVAEFRVPALIAEIRRLQGIIGAATEASHRQEAQMV